jgi:hypothetical protein
MNRLFKSAVVFICTLPQGGLTVKAVHAQETSAPPASLRPTPNCSFTGPGKCPSSPSPSGASRETSRPLSPANDAAAFNPENAEPLQLQGDAAALRLDLHQTTITDVLSTLRATFHVKYRSLIALNEPLNGTYAGTLERVIARVLNGYNYVIKHDSATLDVVIFGKVGEHAVANPGLIPLHQRAVAAYRTTRH